MRFDFFGFFLTCFTACFGLIYLTLVWSDIHAFMGFSEEYRLMGHPLSYMIMIFITSAIANFKPTEPCQKN